MLSQFFLSFLVPVCVELGVESMKITETSISLLGQLNCFLYFHLMAALSGGWFCSRTSNGCVSR
jgi:hypothetical protein